MYSINFERINLKDQEQKNQVRVFLDGFSLKLEENVDYTLVYREKDVIKATASKSGNVLKCFAVSEELRGTGITGELVNTLIDRLFEEGIYHSYIFTKPEYIKVFSSLNFKLVHEVSEVALLESGMHDIEGELIDLETKFCINTKTKKKAIITSFQGFNQETIELITQLSKDSEEIFIFIAEGNKVKIQCLKDLIYENIKNLNNVKVLFGSEYILSFDVFPKYFIKDDELVVKAFNELKLGIFKKYFCSNFNINKIYICEGNSIAIYG